MSSTFQGLTANATPLSTDIVPTVNDPGETPLDRKVTLANFITKAHGLSAGIVRVLAGVMTNSPIANAAISLGIGDTTFAATSDLMTVTGDSGANTIGTITGGYSGQVLRIIFVDTKVTITDTGTGVANTVNLSAAFTSAANTVLTLCFNGTSWREVSRSVNG